MVQIMVFGLPKSFSDAALRSLSQKLKEAVSRLEEARVRPEQLSVFFLSDLRKSGVGDEVYIQIDGLLIKAEKPYQVRHHLAVLVCLAVSEELESGRLVECHIKVFNPHDGY